VDREARCGDLASGPELQEDEKQSFFRALGARMGLGVSKRTCPGVLGAAFIFKSRKRSTDPPNLPGFAVDTFVF
jgi:hypothetical protein